MSFFSKLFVGVVDCKCYGHKNNINMASLVWVSAGTVLRSLVLIFILTLHILPANFLVLGKKKITVYYNRKTILIKSTSSCLYFQSSWQILPCRPIICLRSGSLSFRKSDPIHCWHYLFITPQNICRQCMLINNRRNCYIHVYLKIILIILSCKCNQYITAYYKIIIKQLNVCILLTA